MKGAVLDAVCQRGLNKKYVGCHPMAGTAQSGWSASRQGLFNGAAWVVCFDYAAEQRRATPSSPVDASWLNLWVDCVRLGQRVGADIIPALAAHHDAAVARISHLPHLLAETLAIVGDSGGSLALSLAAGSFRDGTRVAASTPSLVRAMCETNHSAVFTALDEAISLLTDARTTLASTAPSVEELVDAGYRSRVRLEARTNARPVLRVQPGSDTWVKQLAHAESLGARIDLLEVPPQPHDVSTTAQTDPGENDMTHDAPETGVDA